MFCYEYFTDVSKFEKTSLPTKEEFFNKLTDSPISDEDYQHAHRVWETFNMHTFWEYHDLDLQTDVLLLTDVYENFRATSLNYYQTDPCNVYSAPGLSWNSMLKMTDAKLGLLADIDMYVPLY